MRSALNGRTLKAAREHLGLTQTEMADRMGIKNDRTIRRWEDGESEVPAYASIIVEYWIADARRGLSLQYTALED